MRPPDVFDRRDAEDDPDQGRRELRCKHCGSTDVYWRRQTGRWVLFSFTPGVEHVCDQAGSADEFDKEN